MTRQEYNNLTQDEQREARKDLAIGLVCLASMLAMMIVLTFKL